MYHGYISGSPRRSLCAQDAQVTVKIVPKLVTFALRLAHLFVPVSHRLMWANELVVLSDPDGWLKRRRVVYRVACI